MKLVYLSGGPRHRVLDALIASGYEVQEAILGDPEVWPRVAKTVEVARRLGVPVRFIRREGLASLADLLRNRIVLSAGFPYILPPEVVDSAQIILNVHGAPLPRYGGARTLNWVIANGETASAITVHKVDYGVDTGPLLFTDALPVSPFDTSHSLYRRTLEAEPAVVLKALALFKQVGEAALTIQSETTERLPDRLPVHSKVDPSKPLADLIDAIRAADTERFPAYFFYHGQKVCITLWRPDKQGDKDDTL